MTQPTTQHECHCDHKLSGTGAVFYQSTGWIECTVCRGWQRIRKPIDPTNGNERTGYSGYDDGSNKTGAGQ